MATKKEIKEHLKIALKEIGKIVPWYDKKFSAWIFEHPKYPVSYSGDSKEEAIKNYPVYLQDFIEERLNQNLSPLTEKATKGRGGKRKGAGRPKGTKKETKERIYLPKDIARWFHDYPPAIACVRKVMRTR